jgi:hypothetical protein
MVPVDSVIASQDQVESRVIKLEKNDGQLCDQTGSCYIVQLRHDIQPLDLPGHSLTDTA